MEIEFNFRQEPSGLFGYILRPVVKVSLINGNKKVPEVFYVDSGADLTLVPRSVGELLGFKVNNPSKINQIKGIGEQGVPIVLKQVDMNLGEIKFKARIGWCLIEEVPLLLGRIDVFKIFEISFLNDKKTIFKSKIE